MKKIVSIAAGLIKQKKEWNKLNEKNRYLNYGLLGLSTLIDEAGYEIMMFQADNRKPRNLMKIVDEECDINTVDIFLISLTSYYSLEWTSFFCKMVKEETSADIYVGGRWVVGDDENWIKSKLPNVDKVLKGCGESYIIEAIENSNQVVYNQEAGYITSPFKKLNYKLLYKYKSYQPCLEVSRGCGKGCKFCVEGAISLTKMKSPSDIISEIKEVNNLYGHHMNFYFEASNFLPTQKWANEFAASYLSEGLENQWRCETRVDSIKPEIIKILSTAGLKVIDLGLESASHQQLIAMGKCVNPVIYLKKASMLLEECLKSGVLCKVNILLYYNESFATIDETLEWLEIRSNLFKGVSVNQLTLYGYDLDPTFIKHNGTYRDAIEELSQKGYVNIDLSKEINSSNINRVMMYISQKLMTHSDYYLLKSYSYYSTQYGFAEYLKDISNIPQECLSFKKPKSNGIVLFGEIGSGKNYIGNALHDMLDDCYIINLGDVCRDIMDNVSTAKSLTTTESRELGQSVGQELRNIDSNILNYYALGKVISNFKSSEKWTTNLILGGRTYDDIEFWKSRNFVTIGISSEMSKKNEKDRDGCIDIKARKHITELQVSEIVRRGLCDYSIQNNGDNQQLNTQLLKLLLELDFQIDSEYRVSETLNLK